MAATADALALRMSGRRSSVGFTYNRLVIIELVALDVDGTLLKSDGLVSEYTRFVLSRVSSRIPVVLVTARPPRRIKEVSDQTGLGGPAICCNGALLYDPLDDKILDHSPIGSSSARELVTSIRQAIEEVCFAAELGMSFGAEDAYVVLADAEGAAYDGRIADAHALCASPVTKLIVRHPTFALAELQVLVEQVTGSSFAVACSGGQFIEITSAGIDKAAALASHAARLGVDRESVVAFGDLPIDLPMLKWAGLGIAVANADPEVLAAIEKHTASNDEDGVALALEALGF